MSKRERIAFIVEGEVREPQIIRNLSGVFFSHCSIEIITLPAGQNIYMLWKKMKEDDFDSDIIEVLREEDEKTAAQLSGILRDDFSEVYLFFDYDRHQNNVENVEDVLPEMLDNFDNETENGKLYISYPMVEALRDFIPGICGTPDQCYFSLDLMSTYKKYLHCGQQNPGLMLSALKHGSP